MAFRWIYGDERVARLRAAGFSEQLVREVTSSSWEVWAAGGDEFRTWPDEVLALVNSNLEHWLGLVSGDVVPVVHVDESCMHYVLLVDGELYDHGEEWLEPIAGPDAFVVDSLIRARESGRLSEARLHTWADRLGHPEAVRRFRDLAG